MAFDSIGAIQGGAGQPDKAGKSGGGFFERMQARVKEVALFSPEEKAGKQADLNNALKGSIFHQ